MAQEDQVDKAEKIMKNLSRNRHMVTTGQIRKFLTAVNSVSGKIDMYRNQHAGENVQTMPVELQAEVKYLKVKLAYQIGRARPKRQGDVNPVEELAKEAGLMERIDNVKNDMAKYDEFARFIEALVAFHKFYGGKD
jgi:CRISPR-associated protein Csm2